jgi:hypothetical protein
VTLATAIQNAMPELYNVLSGLPGFADTSTSSGNNGEVENAENTRDGVIAATGEQNAEVTSSTVTATQTVLNTWKTTADSMNTTQLLIKTQTITVWTDICKKLTELWNKLLVDTKKTWAEQQNFVFGVLSAIQNKFNTLITESQGWGESLMSGFIRGLKNKEEDLIEELDEITSLVDSYMPHSPAERGALSKLDEYGPSFVGTFAKGITSSIPILEKAMSALSMTAIPVIAGVGTSTTTTTNNATANNFTITLTGSDDDALLSKLMRELHRRGVKF